MSLLFRQVVIIPLKFFQIQLVQFHGFDQCPLIQGCHVEQLQCVRRHVLAYT